MTFLASIVTFPLQQPVAIFLLVLVIILFAPIIFNSLKIPNIVGLIIAGMAVGPYGFNLLARDASFEIFGQVGILYLMFLAGVEIDMYHLKINARKGLLFGLISFIIPMAGGLLASHYILEASWLTSALIASMYASHTLISYPIITRFGLQNRQPVVIAVCGTIVAVFLALLVLAEVGAVATYGSMNPWRLGALLLKGALFTIITGLAYPFLTRRFFRKYSDPVTQFIYILAMVFIASLAAQLIGLEAILGAFYAGLVLNRFIPSRSALLQRIEFVGNAIFIPYFLIGVGMLINVRVIVDGWSVIWIAANMILTAMICKWLAAYIAQKLFHFSSNGRLLLFGLSAGKAAATIAAVMLGYKYGLLDEDLMNGAVLMILVCCAVASIATERGARHERMAITGADLDPSERGNIRQARQLVAVANPVTAEGIMKLALLMRHPSNHTAVTALFVRNNDDQATRSVGANALKLACETAVAADIPVKDLERYDINIVSGIINASKERESTEIVIGLHRKSNIVDTFYGSMIEGLLAATNKMVVMSRCFIPVNTVRSLMVIVPAKAEYETGFREWVARVANLASQLGTRVNFLATPDTIPYIQGLLTAEGYNIRVHFDPYRSWDDFIIFSNVIVEDDLMIVIGARRTSISFSNDLQQLPGFLGRYFRRQNLVVIYPGQFGEESERPAPIDTLSQPIPTRMSPFLLSLQHIKSFYLTQRLELRRRMRMQQLRRDRNNPD